MSKEIYHNPPQLRMQLIDTQIMVARWGRATGKTSLGGWWTADRMNRMPRSGNSITGSTYTHLLTKLAPGIIRAWEALGYREGVHYWFGRKPPKAFKIPTAHQPLLSPKYSVFWWNGSYVQFLSAERGLNNALSTDSIYFDEARFLPYDKVREILLTNRGNKQHFGHLSCHNSTLFTSDAPRSSKSQWINEMEKEVDERAIQVIAQVSLRLNQLKLARRETSSQRKIARLTGQITQYEQWLNEARKGQVYFSKASTLENVHAIGLQTIKNFKRVLSRYDFNMSVLNMDGGPTPNSFYPLLNEEEHGFHSENASYIEGIGIDGLHSIEKDCLWKDSRLYDRNQPLDIALDYNNAINSLAVGQSFLVSENTYRLQSIHYVLGTDRLYLKDVVAKFCRFYRHHKAKQVNYYYDHTAIPGDATGRVNFKQEVVTELRRQGWQVVEKYIGQASNHEDRFEFWIRLLGGADERLPRFQYDIDDASQWQVSAENAGVRQTEKGFKKDKSTETQKDSNGNLKVRPEDSTHISEAVDTLMDGRLGGKMARKATFVDWEG